MHSLIDEASVAHELHLLDVPDAVCKQRLLERNAGGKHPFQVSEADYDLFTSYLSGLAPPSASTSSFTQWEPTRWVMTSAGKTVRGCSL